MDITVRREGSESWRAVLDDGRGWRCTIGRGGARDSKREGDGVTPVGAWPLRQVLYRPDRLDPPTTNLPLKALRPDDGWCDDPRHPDYNMAVKLPFPASHEELWRQDEIYDVIAILGYNDDLPRPGAGSAIFLHIARADYSPTAGCVALAPADLLQALAAMGPESRLRVVAD